MLSFSPLLIGVTVVTSSLKRKRGYLDESFSPLLIGVTVVTSGDNANQGYIVDFQSPFNRGNGCNLQERSR